MSNHVYRDICINGEEVANLRRLEVILRRLNAAVDGGTDFGVYADDIDLICRRYQHATEIAQVRGQILQFHRPRSVTDATQPRSPIEGGTPA